MAVEAKKKKKLFQVAKELNLGKETIKDFLEKKGIKVVGLNMRIDDKIYDLILDRFSKEKKAAEAIHKRREDRVREEQEVAEKQRELFETPSEVAETEISDEKIEDSSVDETPVADESAAETDAEAETGTVEQSLPEAEVVSEVEAGESIEPVETETTEEAAEAEKAESETDEAEAETETETGVAEVATEEEVAETELPPRVGDIVFHPMAEQYLERQKKQEEAKRERQRQVLERLKKPQAEDKKHSKKDVAETSGGEEETETDGKRRTKKKDRKKSKFENQDEKDARRRKAFEMLRKERKPIRPQTIPDEEGDAVAKEGRRKRRKKHKKEVDQQEVDTTLKKTLAEMQDAGTGRKKRRKIKAGPGEDEDIETNVIKVTEFITTQDLANLLDTTATEVIRKCLELGLVVTINQRLDMDTIKLLAEEFGFDVEEEEEFGSDFLEDAIEEEDRPEDMLPRPPVVTIMGHVDHGKTSLLDYIRHTNVVAGESGGITQHIGAYEVELDDGRRITFLDTPGHEAFTAMRARGAQVTDIVVLVIAADDRIMPQTEEAIDHAKAAGVSLVIAINKVDKPNANPEAIRKQLADRNILVEDWGGQYQSVDVSAKTGKNVPELLEKILLEAELLDLKANPNKRASGVVLEAQLDKGKGPVATVLVQQGTLNISDNFVIGQHSGRIRAMLNERRQRVKAAGPSEPAQILGIDGVPEAGDRFIVMSGERDARDISTRRQQLKREQDFRQVKLLTLDELSKQIKTGDVKVLKLLVKADVDGSTQALTDALQKLSTDAVEVQVIRRAVGPISESDVILAAASQAIIIGFHVRPAVAAKELAAKESVDIRLYKVIYDAIEDVEKALEGLLEPLEREVVTGSAEIREVFKISRIGTIGGCMITSGKINRNSNVRIVRNDVEIYDGKLGSLKRFKEDVREVASGYECGLSIENYNDIKVGDIIEAYEIVLEAQTLR